MVTHTLDITRYLEQGTHCDRVFLGHVKNHCMRDIVRDLFIEVVYIFLCIVDQGLCLLVVLKDSLDTSLNVLAGHLEHTAHLVTKGPYQDFSTDLVVVAYHVGIEVLKTVNAVIAALLVRYDELYELNDVLTERQQYDR